MPHAALVSAAQMNSEGHAAKASNQIVVGLERAPEIGDRIFAARPHRVERGTVDVGGVAGRVDMHIAASSSGEPGDHRALDLDHIGEKVLHRRDRPARN